MPKWKLDEAGQLVDAEGNVVKVGDDVVTFAEIEGAKTQRDIDETVEKRLARQNARIQTLEAQADKTPGLEKMLEELKAEKAQLEEQVAAVKEQAKAESQAQLAKIQTDRDKLKADLDAERLGRIRDQVSTLILAAAKDRFNDTALDVVPHLLGAHKREPKKGADGKDTGEFVDYFRIRVPKEGADGEYEEKYVPVEQALDSWAEAHPHHLRPTGNAGSGGGQYVAGAGVNPWAKNTWNVTKQHELMSREPGKAKSLMQAAGVPVPVQFG